MTDAAPHQDLLLRGVRRYGRAATDVWFRSGRIAGLLTPGTNLASTADARTIPASGLILLPGLVDLHTHLREPGGEPAGTIQTGTRAAAAGGYTDVFAMANTDPITDTPARVRALHSRTHSVTSARVHPVGAITTGLLGEQLTPIGEMAAVGVTVFSDDGRCVNSSALMRTALQETARLNVVIAQHAQDGDLAADGQINDGPAAQLTGLPQWPPVAEHIVIARDVLLAADTGAALHVCHLSTRRSIEIVRWAKAQGWQVTAEVTPHHLLLTDELAALADPRYKVNPLFGNALPTERVATK